MDEFDIYIGGIAEDRGEPPAARVARAFGLPELRAREFVASLPRVVKRSVPADQAERYARLLHEIGAVFELRRSPIRPVQTIGVSGSPGRRERDQDGLDQHGAVLPLPDLRGAPIPAWNPAAAPTLRESRPPPPHTQQTLREAAPAEVFAVRYAAPPRSAQPRVEARPAPAPAPAPAHPVSQAWAPTMPAPVRAPAPPPSPSPVGGSPGSPHGQPPWLALGADKYEAELEQLSAPPPAQPTDRAPPAGATRLPARPPGPRPFAVYSTGQITPAGVPLGRESRSDPPFLLRLAMRAVLGGSLFLILASVRHCHLFPTDVEAALAEWGAGPAAEAAALGPVALDWMASDLHQVTGGDKDRARGIAERLKAAGAVEVYVGAIMNVGAVKLAGELLVELPPDEQKRKAVLATYAELMTATFGGAAVAAPDDRSSVLRIVL